MIHATCKFMHSSFSMVSVTTNTKVFSQQSAQHGVDLTAHILDQDETLHWQYSSGRMGLWTCNNSICLNNLCSYGTAQANCVICTCFAVNLASIETRLGEELDVFGIVVKIVYVAVLNDHMMPRVEPSHDATNSFVQA